MLRKEELTDFLGHIQTSENSSVNTYLAYRTDLDQLWGFLTAHMTDDQGWQDVQQEHLDAYVSHLNAKGYSRATVARKLAASKSFFRALGDRQLIIANPSQKIRVPRITKKAPTILSPNEVHELIQAAGTHGSRGLRDRAIIAVLYSTGMRVTEVTSLKLSEVDTDQQQLTCIRRGQRIRRIPLTSEASDALAEYISRGRTELLGRQPTDNVFLNPAGAGLTRQAVWMMIKNCARSAGIQKTVTPHTLRHTRAAHMLEGGEDVHRVREWLGHANLSTTQSYLQKPDGPECAQIAPAPMTHARSEAQLAPISAV
jgi:integrase/recombinase XerD